MNKWRSPVLIFSALTIFSLIVAGIYVLSLRANEQNMMHFWDQENSANSSTIDHGPWQSILDNYVIKDHSGINRVDYEALVDDVALLEDYIQSLSSIDPRGYGKQEQMAYWINFYNALTVKLIVENYPVDSITELGKNKLAFGPWDDNLAIVTGQTLTLNDIEHRILRAIWTDHRIHFAVNCASIGCPNLQTRAFTSKNLEDLLGQGAIEYLTHSRGLRFESETLVLSSIFDWYTNDFGANEQELFATLSQYLPSGVGRDLEQYSGSIRYEYDWTLNQID